MSSNSSFQNLLSRLRNGDQQRAAEQIVTRFGGRLAALASRRMSEKLRRRVGAEDVVQSVFATFFRRQGGGEIELRDWESLWALLARITVCRVLRHHEHNAAALRAMDREVPLNDEAWERVRALDRDPGEQEVVTACKLYEELVAGLSERNRLIVQGLCDDKPLAVIARELGTSLSTVDRGVRRAKERLAELLAEAES
jgi:RNA polymerase sigma-70 factor, ECF subfamily